MKPLSAALALLAAAGVLAARHTPPQPEGRVRQLMDAGWRFHLGDPPDAGVAGQPLEGWRWRVAEHGEQDADTFAAPGVETNGVEWRGAAVGQDTFHGRVGFAWYRTTLPEVPGPHRALHFETVDDNATVWVNGKRLLHHEGWSDPFDVPLDTVWHEGGVNTVAVLVENTAGAGGIGPAQVQSGDPEQARGPALEQYDDHDWRQVHLPHDFVVEGTFSEQADGSHGFLPAGVGWYRKTFDLPASDRDRTHSIWIDFDGIYRDSRVWLNGKLLGRHKSGYTGVRYDITEAAHFGGSNTLAVRADARSFEGWWYEGGGVYRHVWLEKSAPLHIDPCVFVSTDVPSPDRAAIRVETCLTNEGPAPADCRLESEIVAPDGKHVATIASDQNVVPETTNRAKQTVVIGSPRLWSLEDPALYRLKTSIVQNGRTVDSVTTPFGIRTCRWDPEKGFFLNGKPVKLKGTCNHQDGPGVGTAMPDSMLEWRIRRLKEMGSNAYRCSHNPPARELLDACDRLGMLVMDENRHLGDTYRDHAPAGTTYSDLSDLKDLIVRDRNHPSVIMWSMCNEEGLQGSQEGERIFAAMKKVVNELDPTRPVTCAMNGGWGQGISHIEDLQGCNYSPGGYDRFHRDHRDMPMYGSETASTVCTRGIYANDRTKGYVSAYDVNAPPWAQTAEVAWGSVGERAFVAGSFAWTGFDYRGEPTPYWWPCINSHFGIMDTCGFPKDNYYYYQAWWGDKPLVHLLPHWNWPGKEGQPIDVWAYGNTDRVELLLNGRALGAKAMPRFGHVQWSVPYAPGRLEAVGYSGDRVVARDAVETTGPPARIRLTPDRKALPADGEEVAMVTAAIEDAKGRIVPVADNEVEFQTTGVGRVAGVGNGDPSSHEPDHASRRKAFNGLCMAIVQAGDRGGAVDLTAGSPGLQPAHLRLSVGK